MRDDDRCHLSTPETVSKCFQNSCKQWRETDDMITPVYYSHDFLRGLSVFVAYHFAYRNMI